MTTEFFKNCGRKSSWRFLITTATFFGTKGECIIRNLPFLARGFFSWIFIKTILEVKADINQVILTPSPPHLVHVVVECPLRHKRKIKTKEHSAVSQAGNIILVTNWLFKIPYQYHSNNRIELHSHSFIHFYCFIPASKNANLIPPSTLVCR